VTDSAPPAGGAGSSCEEAIVIGSIPFQHSGDTTTSTVTYGYEAGACPGQINSGWGMGSPDDAFVFTPTTAGTYTFSLDAAFDSTLYVVTDCQAVNSTCLGADDQMGSNVVEEVLVSLTVGQTVYVIVDGYGNDTPVNGTYTLSVGEPCAPNCAGKTCGDDGCGASCGECDPFAADGLTACDEAVGQCFDPATIPGATCTNPFEFGTAPGSVQGDTSNLPNTYAIGANECPGKSSAAGEASKDAAYVFTPQTTGTYTVTLESDFDALLYVVEDCGNIPGTCLGGSDNIGTETIVAKMEAGNSYFIIVDGWSNYSDLNGPFTLSISEPCIPSCDGKECGDDGCGTVCGVCDPDDTGALVCDTAAFICIDPSQTEGATCENAFVVDHVPYDHEADTSLMSNNYSTEQDACPGYGTGVGAAPSDAVYKFTPNVTGVYTITVDATFDSTPYVITDCNDVSGTCVGATDSFGVEELVVTLDAGQEYSIIVDGWSNSSKVGGPYSINIGEPCIPSCDGKECGDNGCGTTCGTCDPEGATGYCDPQANVCIDPASAPGASCDNAIAISDSDLGVPQPGNSAGMVNSYLYSDDACAGETYGAGGGSGDVAYRFSPSVGGIYTCTVDADFDSVIYAVSDCGSVDGTCLGAADNGNPEELKLALAPGQPIFIIVDGWSDTSDQSGPFTLTVSEPCTPSCVGKNCGDDGCGFSCGECNPEDPSGSTVCHPKDYQCVAPGSAGGATCEDAFPVSALPFEDNFSTTVSTSDYGYSANACEGETTGWGSASNDVIYRFVPPSDGTYTVALQAAFDSNLFVVSDCGNVDGTCLGADEEIGSNVVEELVLELTSGQPYYVIVDGWGNSSNVQGDYNLKIYEGAPVAE
ncbi:MAG: hypothetical protein VX938_05665, partial [Myxococcota bacterium]|nr:hypothetical protein [Myxococcota bacterium]